ncbi:MAG TPA: lysophospholipid acyltransferase family protein [Sphingomicrobium sp.]|nr:lysophospholipid acyltransferase family protein [Sphingomicrobium sp.]
MPLVRSLAYALIFYSATLLYVLVGLTVGLFSTGAMRTVVHGWADLHEWLSVHVLGVRMQVVGELPRTACLVAVKHQSMYETIQMLRVAQTPVVVLKHELADLPLFGWMTRRYGVIPVDRNAGARALRTMLTAARQAIADRRPVVIFPEGTRVPPGQKPELRSGFAGIYRALGLPVVPIAMDSGRLWGRGLVKRPGLVTFQIGDVIPAGLPREEIEARVHAAINSLNP